MELCLEKMTINISTPFVEVFDEAKWKINFLTNPFIFNSPFDECTPMILMNCLKDDLKDLILVIDIFTEDLVSDCFVRFINGFNTLVICCNLTICCFTSNKTNNKNIVSELYKQ